MNKTQCQVCGEEFSSKTRIKYIKKNGMCEECDNEFWDEDEDDLGIGEFEQPTGPNHFMNSVSDLDNGGRRAREYLKGEG